jgi:3-oxoacyl-[acyl-carrier protein] reductase
MPENKVAIVTGGGTGVGAETAKLLVQKGFKVAIVFKHSASEASETVDRCRAFGVDAMSVQGDVAIDADCRRAAAAAESKWGRIDVLVNSAGTTQFAPMNDLEAQTADDFQKVYAVNTIGPFQMARAVSASMQRGEAGAIVNVSTVGSLNGNGSSYSYVTSKAALNILTVALARSLAPRIRVNAVLPGLIDTRWLKIGLGDAAYQRVRDDWAEAAALETICSASDVAQSIVWLALEAKLMTGQLITVDGGFLLGRPTRVAR